LPNTYGPVDGHWIIPVKTGKHLEAVMKVMETVTSDEVQMIASRQTARVTPLTNDAVKKAFAADLAFMKGKHVQSIFKSKPAAYPKPPLYDGNGKKHMNTAFDAYVNGTKDLNTALREAAEAHNKDIEAEQAR
jgi:multiple sugar transport system substrate-binding protein